MEKTVAIRCKAAFDLSFTQLHDFQGDLKELSEENYERLKNEIAKTGFAFAPHAWQSPSDQQWYLVDGHQRVKTVRRMNEEGWTIPHLPVVPVEASTYEEAKRRVLQGTSQYGHMTEGGLKAFITDSKLSIQDIQMSFDFPTINLPSFVKEHFRDTSEEEDEKAEETPEVPVTTVVQPGEYWTLGNHRVLCGDSTNPEDVKKLLDGSKPDMVFTSPPYNADMAYNSYNDKLPEGDYFKLLHAVLKNAFDFSTENAWVLWNMGVSHNTKFWRQVAMAEDIGFNVDRTFCWKKRGTTGVPVFQHTRNNPVTKNYMPHFGFELIWTFRKNKDKGTKFLSGELMDRRQLDVWDISQSGDNTKDRAGHPAAFPVALAQDGVELFADEVVFEPFGGSGSTLIACEKAKRKCYLMEIDPHYVQVIVERFAKYTGIDPVRSDGKPWSEIKTATQI